MYLNMWMIVNRLWVLEPEIHLKSGRPREIRGIRSYAAENYASLTMRENDVICHYKDEYFILPDIERDVAYGLLLDVFDYYDNLLEQLQAAVKQMQYQRAVDLCHPALSNPLLLLDVNYKVMAMSSQYGAEEVDAEWRYLLANGYSSVQAVHVLQQKRGDSGILPGEQEHKFEHQRLEPKGCMNYSCRLRAQGELCGFLVAMEKTRPINSGDYEFLLLLADILAPQIQKTNFKNLYRWGSSVFSKLLGGQEVSGEELQMQLQYYDWQEADAYQVMVLKYRSEAEGTMMYRLLRSSLIQNIPLCVAEIHEDRIVLLLNVDRSDTDKANKIIEEISVRNGVDDYVSLSVPGIRRIEYLYQQCLFFLRMEKVSHGQYAHLFSLQAAAFLLTETDNNRKYFAVYPPIRRMWENRDEKDREALDTLRVYLKNHLSPAETSRQLFIAKNTLNYRLTRLKERLQLDFKDAQLCFYYLLSLEFLLAAERAAEIEKKDSP